VSLRYFNVYGPRQDPTSQYAAVIPRFIHWSLGGERLEVHGDGLQSRDFTYIDNVVTANLLAAQCRMGSEKYSMSGKVVLIRFSISPIYSRTSSG
jgi:nucleoside-diphosphate-sugar epimerase